jgi:hypothetical protein
MTGEGVSGERASGTPVAVNPWNGGMQDTRRQNASVDGPGCRGEDGLTARSEGTSVPTLSTYPVECGPSVDQHKHTHTALSSAHTALDPSPGL